MHPHAARSPWGHWQTYVLPIMVLGMVALLGILFFLRGRSILQDQLKSQLRNTAAAAAMQFDGAKLLQIQQREDVDGDAFRDASERLRRLRDEQPGIRFAYILRRTDDPFTVTFIADADTLLSVEELDRNDNGMVDQNEEPSYPGDTYDVSDVPALQGEAFERPVTDHEVTEDQWGKLISGYAPIRRFDTGQVVATLGIDMRAEDYISLSHSLFSPVAFLLLIIGSVVIAGGLTMIAWQRRIDALKRINDERSGLLQLTFHQLGEPLTIFKWSLETLKDIKPKNTGKEVWEECTSSMEEGIHRLNDIIDALASAEQVELGTFTYAPIRQAFEPIAQELVNSFAELLEHRKQTVQTHIDTMPEISCDSVLLKRVLGELIENASDYSPSGTVIDLTARLRAGKLEVTVSDKGCGIPSQDLERVGQKYVRGSNASIYKVDGNGLGLYTARGIIEMAHGELRVKSEEGKGTDVTFVLPA